MTPSTTTLASVVLAGLLATGSGGGLDDSKRAWSTRLDLESVGALLGVYRGAVDQPVLPEDWISLREYAKRLPEIYATRLPSTDGWGERYMVGIFEDRLTVVSAGPDGVHDVVARSKEDPAVETGGGPVDDMVLRVGEGVLNAPKTTRDRQATTMADLRSVATAVESFSIDHNLYPKLTGRPDTLDYIRDAIEPMYIRKLPLTDGWGNPFLYWSDSLEYFIVSAGADGVLDEAWHLVAFEKQGRGETHDPNADILFVGGQFTQWPARDRERP